MDLIYSTFGEAFGGAAVSSGAVAAGSYATVGGIPPFYVNGSMPSVCRPAVSAYCYPVSCINRAYRAYTCKITGKRGLI